MSFDGLDLDKMFQEAAGASEDTGEEEVGEKTKKAEKPEKQSPKKTKQPEKEMQKPTPKQQPEPRNTQKKEYETNAYEEDTRTNETTKRAPLYKNKSDKLGPIEKPRTSVSNDKVNVDSITRILAMKAVLDNYNSSELEFVRSYFQDDNADDANLIHKAIVTNRRDLEALDEIVEARSQTSAERAFYLMELGFSKIEAIYEQVDLITGELESIEKVSELNKIKVCRIIESQISSMPEEIFSYISKLQEFTNKALM